MGLDKQTPMILTKLKVDPSLLHLQLVIRLRLLVIVTFKHKIKHQLENRR